MLVRLDHVASVIANVDDGIDGVIWFSVPEATEWQRIGNQINAAMIFGAGALRKCVVS